MLPPQQSLPWPAQVQQEHLPQCGRSKQVILPSIARTRRTIGSADGNECIPLFQAVQPLRGSSRSPPFDLVLQQLLAWENTHALIHVDLSRKGSKPVTEKISLSQRIILAFEARPRSKAVLPSDTRHNV